MGKWVLIASTAAILASAGIARAADYEDGGGDYYGNLHSGLDLDATNTTPSLLIPYANFGGKVGYDQGSDSWGYQFDGDINYTDASWISSTATAKGSLTTYDTAAHLTRIIDQDKKIGIFAGYSGLSLSASGISGISSTSTSASLALGIVGIGVEGLIALSDQTSAQLRAAIVDPAYVSASSSDGTTTTSTSRFDLGMGLGFAVSGGLSHRFTRNVGVRADAAYANINYNSVGGFSLYNAGVTAQYTFDEAPFTIGATLGYMGGSLDSGSGGAFNAGIKATYSFGGPVAGAKGRLFHSGLFNLVN